MRTLEQALREHLGSNKITARRDGEAYAVKDGERSARVTIAGDGERDAALGSALFHTLAAQLRAQFEGYDRKSMSISDDEYASFVAVQEPVDVAQ